MCWGETCFLVASVATDNVLVTDLIQTYNCGMASAVNLLWLQYQIAKKRELVNNSWIWE